MLRAILFDFNGVLVDDEPLHLEILQRVLAEEGLSVSPEEYYARYLGLDDRACFGAILASAGRPIPALQLMRLVARKASYYQAAIREHGYPHSEGAVRLARAAHAAEMTLGVVSGALRDEVEGGLRHAGTRDLFKVLVTAEDVEEGKPNPAGYRRALAEINALPPLPARLVHPHEVLAIEDSPAGLAAAADCGFVTLGVARAYAANRLGRADFVTSDLEALTLTQLQEMFSEVSQR